MPLPHKVAGWCRHARLGTQRRRAQADGSSSASGEHANDRSWWAVHRGAVLLTARLTLMAALAAYATFLSYELVQVVRHVEPVPYSGRLQALPPHAIELADTQIGARYRKDYDAAAASGKLLPPSHPDVLLVRRIGEAVAAAAAQGAEGKAAERLRGVQWEFHVVEDSHIVRCYIQHGGKVWITEGLLEQYERDEGIIAAVLAHEVAHEAAQHTVESITLFFVFANLAALWSLATLHRRAPWWDTAAGWAAFMALAFHFSSSSVPFLRPLHWYQEYEADAIGARIMARAGFDPASGTLFHFIGSCSQDGEPDLVSALTSTHPSDTSRAERSVKGLHEACKIYTEAGFGTCEATWEHFKQVVQQYVALGVGPTDRG